MRPGGWPLGCPSVWTETAAESLELTSLVLAASCWQCCTSRPNRVRNAAVFGASSETSSCCNRSRGNMSSVRSGYSAEC